MIIKKYEEKPICIREVNDNLRRVKLGMELTRPLKQLNTHCEFRKKYEQAKKGITTGDIVIDSFVDLAKRKDFDPKWTEAFLDSMEMDLTKTTYATLDETLQYVYGAAEVMGLYMVNLLGLDKKAYYYSRYLGRALQCINAIRDISEDNQFGRSYIPLTDLDHYGLKSLDYKYTKKHPEQFSEFIKGQVQRYYHWQEIGEKGYKSNN